MKSTCFSQCFGRAQSDLNDNFGQTSVATCFNVETMSRISCLPTGHEVHWCVQLWLAMRNSKRPCDVLRSCRLVSETTLFFLFFLKFFGLDIPKKKKHTFQFLERWTTAFWLSWTLNLQSFRAVYLKCCGFGGQNSQVFEDVYLP